MKVLKLSIVMIFAILALVAVASAAIPVSVTATMEHPDPYVDTTPYWFFNITAGGNGDLPNGMYDGYCADASIYTTIPIISAITTFPLYDSRAPGSFPLGVHSANWNKINYVLNNKQGADAKTLQALFWYYSGTLADQPAAIYDHAKFDAIKADTDANGGSFVPSALGEHYAVLFWNPEQRQLAFIETVIPIIPGPVPEFPSLALPVAMMFGVAFIVHVVKGREK